ncbi:MAG: glycosyltransferase family 2 protein [bacterium]
MRFSIIIPAYNAEGYLQRCLDSIVSQDFANYEVIVIDDGSTDGTAPLLKQYPQVKVISQPNQGMATARNRGLEMVQGDYILFVDSDDRLCPSALATLAPHLGGEDIVGFGTQIYNESTGIYTDNPIQPTAAPMAGWDYFNRHRLEATPVHFVCIWQRAYRRAFLEEKGLRFVDGLRRAEDDLFTTMTMLHAGSVKTIADCLYIYHLRTNSITRTTDPKLNADSWLVQQILADTFIPMQAIDKSVIYQVLASNYINRLSKKGNTLTATEWEQFRQVCITPRHRRLYRIARVSPALLRLYNRLCSSLR